MRRTSRPSSPRRSTRLLKKSKSISLSREYTGFKTGLSRNQTVSKWRFSAACQKIHAASGIGAPAPCLSANQERAGRLKMVRAVGVEPTRIATADFESAASTVSPRPRELVCSSTGPAGRLGEAVKIGAILAAPRGRSMPGSRWRWQTRRRLAPRPSKISWDRASRRPRRLPSILRHQSCAINLALTRRA
jgi:hypothetical protein